MMTPLGDRLTERGLIVETDEAPHEADLDWRVTLCEGRIRARWAHIGAHPLGSVISDHWGKLYNIDTLDNLVDAIVGMNSKYCTWTGSAPTDFTVPATDYGIPIRMTSEVAYDDRNRACGVTGKITLVGVPGRGPPIWHGYPFTLILPEGGKYFGFEFLDIPNGEAVQHGCEHRYRARAYQPKII